MTPVAVGGVKHTKQTKMEENRNKGSETSSKSGYLRSNAVSEHCSCSMKEKKRKAHLEECESQFVCRTHWIYYLGNRVLLDRVLVPRVAMIDFF